MKNTKKTLRFITRLPALLGAMIFTLAGTAVAQTQQLPITAWTSLLPSTAFSCWPDPESGNVLCFDTWGKRNSFFNLGLDTSVTGNVTVRDLGDGTQQVTIHVRTTNGICWGFNSNNQIAFGYTPLQVLNNVGPAALGHTTWRIVQVPQPVGPVRPWPLESLMGTLSCEGLLRAGSGYPEGTEGFAQTTQVGLGDTGVPDGCPPEQDANCFPAEKVQFQPTGN